MKLLKFYADWCGPCKTQAKVLESLDNVIIENIDVDTDEGEELADKYNIRGCPTIIFLDNNDNVLERFNGLTSLEDLNKALEKHKDE